MGDQDKAALGVAILLVLLLSWLVPGGAAS